MDYQTVQTLISSLGFPIVMCCAMGWYIKYLNETFMNELNNMIEKCSNEINENHAMIKSNKELLEKLNESIKENGKN